MNDGSDFKSGLNCALSALRVNSFAMGICAYNLANLSTSGFVPVQLYLADGPAARGVRVDSLIRNGQPVGTSGNFADDNRSITDSGDFCSIGTDVAKEFVQMIAIEKSFAANGKTVRIFDELAETTLNIKT